ncbi:MAG TPA: nucleoside triphosphate pyrophosphatase [Nitrospirota bacterium]|nr:nucleoside triphosphate pyrophosphatase [Nitrospirota bacterium]
MRKSIILASNSPRRRDLLRQVGIEFTTAPEDVDESRIPGESPEEYAVRVAADKAKAAAERTGEGVIIAADTIVVLEDRVLGKPSDIQEAERMLEMLSGRMHHVITGLVVLDAGSKRMLSRAADTKVWFRKLAADEIRSYVASGEPLDKAGAYGIQGSGALLVERIEGCYFNVVGLPLSILSEMLKDINN